MARVGIVMGSDSDMPVMAKAADILEELGVDYEMTIISAHREPDVFFEYAKSAEEKGFKVIIAGAGMSGQIVGLHSAGVDLLLEKRSHTPFIVEVNGQGDHIYQDMFARNSIYTNQLKEIIKLC